MPRSQDLVDFHANDRQNQLHYPLHMHTHRVIIAIVTFAFSKSIHVQVMSCISLSSVTLTAVWFESIYCTGSIWPQVGITLCIGWRRYSIVITIVERDTGKYHEFIALVSRSTMVITILSYGAIANLRWIECRGSNSSDIATPPGNKKINFERS